MDSILKQQSSLYDQAMSRLDQLYATLERENEASMGYPVTKGFDYSKLYRFLKIPLNNVGDPFQSGTYKVHSHQLEVEVVEFFADLFRAPQDNYWGYVTNGGTEGNLFGVYTARKKYPDGLVYYTDAAHYSIRKNIDILGMESVLVETGADDIIDLAHFEQVVDSSRPAIVVANIGSTMREAKDDIKAIRATLEKRGLKDIYIHSDAALCGAIAPFLKERPHFDFADGCDSIAVSGHKFIGCPMPCGVVVCKIDNVETQSQYVSYIDGFDHTITGSRNGITPVFLWYQLISLGKAGLQERVERCLSHAAYAEARLRALGLDVMRNRDAITVVFPKPSSELISKWQLACQGDIAHLICMPNISLAHIDAFLSDMSRAQPGS
ncbi:histidine decarboxylase [Pseudobacteriovorax antillogorgiicola]|uniref:L-histidine carboxy-lyase (Histamine-forming) n=1 Tax=Pseudobacteriovorax antillogorgiicola TaxID=1513793 RepID=A0A1Y6CJX6_9BACT|nr:histidine decarboxylase [Pseudobacteriovorax antillogorgiicola]TCS46351.1 L-histidine carboxy-lyase (histamine-forming) [Pseudobacteriovorax antillogorgiicola]SMF68129.1 L-histidine carboxy-lyase (histamine-forming) [Pseudobacteriovorax antillogorgiicola]